MSKPNINPKIAPLFHPTTFKFSINQVSTVESIRKDKYPKGILRNASSAVNKNGLDLVYNFASSPACRNKSNPITENQLIKIIAIVLFTVSFV
ncbi:MAG: hypothetical protein A2Z35_00305 [Actinobacteria bacterium RBG_19FT_COMBO_36_27]|nr:MAG: hypothetical protein A2Z35_00305 [Actinobacteria bacterium RBG_19FT_COMBO_36_27]